MLHELAYPHSVRAFARYAVAPQKRTALISMLARDAGNDLDMPVLVVLSSLHEHGAGLLQGPEEGLARTSQYAFFAYHECQVPLQVLEELASLHEVPRLMQDFRSAGKFLSDFVEPLSRRARGLLPGTPGTVRPPLQSSAALH